MDLIVTTTTAIGQRIIDVTSCKPGAVICDVARPPDIEEWEANLRPDVLVIESGEILLPGDPDFGFDIGLPPKTAYACLAETALLAMEGRFEDYSIGRELELDKVKEIYRLFRKHGLELAGMRSFDKYVTDADLARRKRLADELRADPARFARVQEAARRGLEKGDRRTAARQEREERTGQGWRLGLLAAGSATLLSVILSVIFRRSKKSHGAAVSRECNKSSHQANAPSEHTPSEPTPGVPTQSERTPTDRRPCERTKRVKSQ